ncbi:RNA polymerase sigma-70 factor [Puteibacter caeruleilacunae]|nr:RNA polymerase sigma-70 factor [Puteibacter caeruleilacunae]
MNSNLRNIESELVKKLKEGDQQAFAELFERFSNRLYHFALGYLGSGPIAEEIVQDVFLKIWEKRADLKPEQSFKSYIFTITFNSIRKFFIRKDLEESYKQQFAAEFMVHTSRDEERIDYEWMLKEVDRIINKLPERRREIFILSRKEELSINEIAEKLDLAPKTVKNQLTEASKFIKEELKDNNNLELILYFSLFYK